MLCSFCAKSEPVRIEISSICLRICPFCKATFLPAEQFPELRRTLLDTTKIHWINVLDKTAKIDFGDVRCLEHGEPLVKGLVPGFSYEALVPNCCSLQHLTPGIMRQIIDLGAGTSKFSKPPQKGGLARLLAAPLFYLWEKRNPAAEDEIDRLQYNSKFKAVLEGSGCG
jgi:hypothetical protein